MRVFPMKSYDLKKKIEADHRSEMFGASVVERSSTSAVVIYWPIRLHPKMWIDQHIVDAGWYITRTEQSADKILDYVEPITVAPILVTESLFHATRSENVVLIRNSGIVPGLIGKTWMNRTYHTPRSFHAKSLCDAHTFIRSFIAGTSAIEGAHGPTPEQLGEWEIFSFGPKSEVFFLDAEMSGAVWTEALIAPDRLTLENQWRSMVVKPSSLSG